MSYVEGFTVSEKRKKIWDKQIDLLNLVDDICSKHNIEYFAICGTLLGAIRHDGFIPWDDDIDLGMRRKEYNQFIKIAKEELGDIFYLQEPGKDEAGNYYYGHVKIRNSKTTAIRKVNWKTGQTFNQGIFIDIFPIDNVPDDITERKQFLEKVNKLHEFQKYCEYWYYESDQHGVASRIKFGIKKVLYLLLNPKKFYEKYEQYVQKYNGIDTECFGIISEFVMERFIWNKNDFIDIENHKFENTQIKIPCGYNNILDSSYGNWHEYVMKGDLHGEIFYDAEASYLNYLSKYNEYIDDSFYIL